MKATTIALSREDDRLLLRAAREPKISPSEFIRQQSCSNNTAGILSREAPESCAR
jgi:hypothetical protein